MSSEALGKRYALARDTYYSRATDSQEDIVAGERSAQRARKVTTSGDMERELARSAPRTDGNHPDGERPSLLQELPAELRILVYDFVAGEAIVLVNPKQPGIITDGSPLLRVSKAIRGEYLDVLTKKSIIVAEIKDFKFQPLVSFLNRLDRRTLFLLRRTEQPAKRSIRIIIFLEEVWYCPKKFTRRLQQWLIRCTTPSGTKKSANVEFSYEIKIPNPTRRIPPGQQLYPFKWCLLDTWPKPNGTRFFDELIKIIVAINSADDEVKVWRAERFAEVAESWPTWPDWALEGERHPCSLFYKARVM